MIENCSILYQINLINKLRICYINETKYLNLKMKTLSYVWLWNYVSKLNITYNKNVIIIQGYHNM